MRRTLLIIGDGNHQFVYHYANILRSKSIFSKIDVLTYQQVRNEYQVAYDNIYSVNDYQFFERLIIKIKGIRSIYRLFKTNSVAKNLDHYDYVHYQFVGTESLHIRHNFKSSKQIYSIWGSDYYRADANAIKKIYSACNDAHAVTFSNEMTLDHFKKKYSWVKGNLYVCRFGLTPLDTIESLSESKEKSKNVLGWNPQKLSVTIGYNLSCSQRHLEILSAIKIISGIKDKIELIIPITYGSDMVYKEELLSYLRNIDISVKIYDHFLDENSIARIRNATDIMIQLQITDQFSGSMQEHLFCSNVVITGSWLPYDTLIKNGIYFLQVDHINQINSVLNEVIDNYDIFSSMTVNNGVRIKELSSWESNIDNWAKLYD